MIFPESKEELKSEEFCNSDEISDSRELVTFISISEDTISDTEICLDDVTKKPEYFQATKFFNECEQKRRALQHNSIYIDIEESDSKEQEEKYPESLESLENPAINCSKCNHIVAHGESYREIECCDAKNKICMNCYGSGALGFKYECNSCNETACIRYTSKSKNKVLFVRFLNNCRGFTILYFLVEFILMDHNNDFLKMVALLEACFCFGNLFRMSNIPFLRLTEAGYALLYNANENECLKFLKDLVRLIVYLELIRQGFSYDVAFIWTSSTSHALYVLTPVGIGILFGDKIWYDKYLKKLHQDKGLTETFSVEDKNITCDICWEKIKDPNKVVLYKCCEKDESKKYIDTSCRDQIQDKTVCPFCRNPMVKENAMKNIINTNLCIVVFIYFLFDWIFLLSFKLNGHVKYLMMAGDSTIVISLTGGFFAIIDSYGNNRARATYTVMLLLFLSARVVETVLFTMSSVKREYIVLLTSFSIYCVVMLAYAIALGTMLLIRKVVLSPEIEYKHISDLKYNRLSCHLS